MTQSQSAFVGEHVNHQHTEVPHASQVPHHDWHPDMSREKPEWRTAHSRERERHLALDEHGRYHVKEGDTLFDIAIRLLKETNESTNAAAILSKVNHIAQQNFENCPGLRDNPHLLQPGQVLRILADGVNALSIPRLPIADGGQVPPAEVQYAPAPPQVAAPQDVPSPAQVSAAQDVPPPSPAQVAAAPVDNSQGSAPADVVPPPPAPVEQVLPPATYGAKSTAPQIGEATTYGVDTPAVAYPAPSPAPDAAYEGAQPGGSYTDQEASRLSSMMVNDPHRAAAELRDQISQLDPQTAGRLITETKNDEIAGGLGDLQIQAEFDQYGRDTGLRNVTMATPDGIEQIAELQSRPASSSGENPLGLVAGVVVGDLLWQKQHGVDFNDDRYRSWCNREQTRENYWNANNGQFVQNWQNQEYRNQFQKQNWQQVAFNPTENNTYITNNRYDTTINNRQVNTSAINQTINNTTKFVDSHVPMTADGQPMHRPIPVMHMPQILGGNKSPQVRPQENIRVATASDAKPVVAQSQQGPSRDKAFWQSQADAAKQMHAESAKSQTPEQAQLVKEMEAEQRQRAAEKAKAENPKAETARKAQPADSNWMQRQADAMKAVPGPGAVQRTPEQQKADMAKEKEADQKREAADRASAEQERKTEPPVPNWMQRQADAMKAVPKQDNAQSTTPVQIPQLAGVH